MIKNVNFGNNGHKLSRQEERKVDRILEQASLYQERQLLKKNIQAAISFILAPMVKALPAGTKKVRLVYKPSGNQVAAKTLEKMRREAGKRW
jgi:hypothetical protein